MRTSQHLFTAAHTASVILHNGPESKCAFTCKCSHMCCSKFGHTTPCEMRYAATRRLQHPPATAAAAAAIGCWCVSVNEGGNALGLSGSAAAAPPPAPAAECRMDGRVAPLAATYGLAHARGGVVVGGGDSIFCGVFVLSRRLRWR